MGSLTPEHYNITKQMMEKYISDINDYLSKTHPIYFINDIKKQIDEGNQIIGRINVMITALKDDSDRRQQWEEYKQNMIECVDKMRKEHNDII